MGNVNLGKVRGNMWYAGTVMSGTSKSGTIFEESGISRAYENDLYLNAENGYVYQCSLGGKADTAEWIYVGSVRGPMPETTDELNSTSRTMALSANAGRILNEKIVNAGLYAQCIIIDCSKEVHTVKLLIENKDTEIHLTDTEGHSVDYSYTKEGEGQEREIFITVDGISINEVQSTSASIMKCQLFDASGKIVYEIIPSLWDVVNELKMNMAESTTITESKEDASKMATYKTGMISKVMDGIRTIMFPITHAKAVWWNKLENITVFEKINDLVNEHATKENPVFTGTLSRHRKTGTTVGTDSVAIGVNNATVGDMGAIASGMGSVAIGAGTKATSRYATAIGSGTKASGSGTTAIGKDATANGIYAVAMGYLTTANGNVSVAIGNTTTASGDISTAIGSGTTASGDVSVAMGSQTTALDYQLAIGFNNDTSTAEGCSMDSGKGSLFVIGNGTRTGTSNAFRVTRTGETYAKGAYNATGADYAEYAEWADGNPDNEDRRGYFVTFDEEKPTMIRKANTGEYILGIVSGNPCIIGNSDEAWLGKYLMDEFGSMIYEDIEVDETYFDEETCEEKTRKVQTTFYKINPDFDPEKGYTQRAERKEWSAVGWIGVLSVRDDGTCIAGGYCTVAEGGIATASERGTDTYRVLERVTDKIVKVAMK